MIAFTKRMLKKRFIRYVLAGGTSYVIELSTLLSIYHFAHTSREVATAIAFWVGLVLTFVLQKLFSFQDYRKEMKVLTKQGLVYGVLTLWNYGFTILIVSLFNNNDIIFSRTLAQLILVSWSFIIYKKYIFKNVSMPV